MKRLVVGCMTGTSIDALDAALVEIDGAGLEMSARFVRGVTRPLGELSSPLRSLAEQRPASASEIARLAHDLSLLHAMAVDDVARGAQVELVCVHGQTVYHAPPLSWQLFNPAPLVEWLRMPVVYDLRSADLAAGGQGAPITPIADWVLFRSASRGLSRAAVLNLGGFVNVTLLPAESGGDASAKVAEIEGGDICACNQLLDAIARELLGSPFDVDGRAAASGQPHAGALEELQTLLVGQSRQGRSLGTGDEAGAWLKRWRRDAKCEDLCATACRGIALAIASRVGGAAVVAAGGGVRNRGLMAAIASCCGGQVRTTDELGVPAGYREAVCFAVLGALCRDRVPITLPRITGLTAPARVAGCWMYP
jgi:anhydro-N-acetylmuramic acid kinase